MSSTQLLLLGEGAGGGAAPAYIEEVFSTYLYAGTGAAQTITNNIDLSTKDGLVWVKGRTGAWEHKLTDTVRGATKGLISNTTGAQTTDTGGVTSFSTTGFVLGADGNYNYPGGGAYVSWTFREQPKFFDVVTYTGNGGSSQTINHNLGSVPGCMIVKSTNAVNNWKVYHRSLGTPAYEYNLNLNTNDPRDFSPSRWASDPTSTTFSVASNTDVNASGVTYVAYLWAHNAGGFGLTGTDNVISCGSFSTDGSGNATVNLGYEPQWLMYKCSSAVGDWEMVDVMRGWVVGVNNDNGLRANSSDAESTGSNRGEPSSTGFNCVSFPTNRDFIYIAIRRGPMKVPTVGTSVYQGVARTGTSANATVTGASFPPDLTVIAGRSNSSGKTWTDKLRGPNKALLSAYTNAEQTTTDWVTGFTNTGFTLGADAAGADYVNKSPNTYINWMFGRAPSFFDEVCYTGTGSAQNVTHNLTVAPELVIIKSRSNGGSGYSWVVGSSELPSWGRYLQLNEVDSVNGSNNAGPFNNTAPTSSVFTVNTWSETNNSGSTYVAYLFATCAGVSKVDSYTGTGATQTINCGFTTGARFVLIKITNTTGNWFVFDTARGMTVGTNPSLTLNSTAAEDPGSNISTTSVGFTLAASPSYPVNSNGYNYIFLAIA